VFDFDDDGELNNVAGDPTHRQVEIGLAALLKKQCATFSVLIWDTLLSARLQTP
jgi:hypothetical protein